MFTEPNPHQNQPIAQTGADLEKAKAAMIVIHGRGDSAENILNLAREFLHDEDIAYFAPQAANNTWYPLSFMAAIEDNEPGITSGLRAITEIKDYLANQGFDDSSIFLLGFSQGACLASEYVARNPAKYAGLFALSGGLIGPPQTPRDYKGSLEGTPIFLGCSDIDPHIPVERVHETADVFEAMGADVEKRIYEGMGHTVNEDELNYIKKQLSKVGEKS